MYFYVYKMHAIYRVSYRNKKKTTYIILYIHIHTYIYYTFCTVLTFTWQLANASKQQVLKQWFSTRGWEWYKFNYIHKKNSAFKNIKLIKLSLFFLFYYNRLPGVHISLDRRVSKFCLGQKGALKVKTVENHRFKELVWFRGWKWSL